MAPQFVDISAFQPANINWNAYKAWSSQWDGVSRVAMRSSYGTGYTDTHFQRYRAEALTAGIDVILYYHYAYPQYNTPIAEANWQWSVVGDIRDDDQIILDYEEDVIQASANWAEVFLSRQEVNYGGRKPAIYSYPDYIARKLQDERLAQFPLWYANWTFDPNSRPLPPYPWTSYEALQYTDEASNIPGIAGIVDVNVFLLQEKGPNLNLQQAALDTWNSTAFMNGGTPFPTQRGIAEAWFVLYNEGHLLPPPSSPEWSSIDWSGSPVTVQHFYNLRAEWDVNAQIHWFLDGHPYTF